MQYRRKRTMRKTFVDYITKEATKNKDLWVLVGGVGYGVWDDYRINFKDRFINCEASEQAMLDIAVGLALEGKTAIVYSITPFLLYRPFESIRIYLNHEKIPVKLVGSGRDLDYGNLGFTHHSQDDKKIMGVFENIKCYWPEKLEDVIEEFLTNGQPSYLNLKR